MPIDIDISHYNTGTATVSANGTAVTGQGTTWAGAVRAGDLFGTHKGDGTRILSVNSNTSLTLAYPWTGGAQTAAAYEIQRTPYDIGYHRAVEELISSIDSGNLPMFAALTGASNTLPYFDSANSMDVTTLTPFARTLLDDADAAAARTTLELLAVQSDAADATPDRLMRTGAFGLGSDSGILLADFHESLPTGFYRWASNTTINSPVTGGGGAIHFGRQGASIWIAATSGGGASEPRLFIKTHGGASGDWGPWRPLVPLSGSNPNGEFIQIADGTQICWGTTPASSDSESLSLSFPATFVSAPRMSGSPNTSASLSSLNMKFHGISAAGFNFDCITSADARTANGRAGWAAYGRWF